MMKIRRYLPIMMMILLVCVSFVTAQEFSLSTIEGTSSEISAAGISCTAISPDSSGLSVMAASADPDMYTMQNAIEVDSASFALSSEGCGGQEKQVTFGSLNHVNPRVSGSKIVFEEWNSGISSIGMYDITTGGLYPIYPGVQQQTYPDISDKYIVYEQAGTTNNQVTNINVYDLQTQTAKPVSKVTYNQNRPAISGRFVAYEDWRTGNADVYLADLNSGDAKAISVSLSDQKVPDISGNFVVWEDWRNGNADIYLYDISAGEEKQLTSNPYNQKNPRISGNIVVYQDDRNGASDIFAFFLDTGREVQLTYDTSNEVNPDVSGPLVVWEDWRNGNADVYLLDMMSGRIYLLTNDQADQKNPSIFGNNIAWQDYRTGNANIFMYTFSSSGQVTSNYQFYGTASICGNSAPAGTVITALIDGVVRGTYVMQQSGSFGSSYGPYLEVPVYSSDTGKYITFRLNDYMADQTVIVSGGGTQSLSLTTSGSPSPQTYQFSGSAMINSQYAPSGTIITAYIGQEARTQVYVTTSGQYTGLNVPVTSADVGKIITFTASTASGAYQAAQQVTVGEQVVGRFDLTFGSSPAYSIYTFSGAAYFDSQQAPVGTVISALVENQVRGQVTVSSPGSYSGLNVPIYESDNGRTVSFSAKWNGASYLASQQILIGDDVTMMSASIEAASAQGIARQLDLTFPLTSQAKYRFYGQATLDGSSLASGTIINALIDGQVRGQIKVTLSGRYGSEVGPYLEVPIYASDVGKTINFETNSGATGDASQLIVSGLTIKKNINFRSTPLSSVDFTASPTQGPAPLKVKFTDKSTGSIRSYYWDFGDGTTSTDKNPTHSYSNSGIYSVGLMITYWNGQTKSTVKQNLVTVGIVTPPDARIGLNPGWNFISIPKMLADGQNTAKALFSHVQVGGHSIFAYNPRSMSWNTIGASTVINPLDAVWIYSDKQDTVYLYFAGDALQIPPTKKLTKGWNTFGVTSLNTVPANNALLSVKEKWIYVIGFESATQKYQTTIMNVPDSYQSPLYPGYGYWIYMSEDGDLAAIGL